MKLTLTCDEVVLYRDDTTISPNIYTTFVRAVGVNSDTFTTVNVTLSDRGITLAHDVECGFEPNVQLKKICILNLPTGQRFRTLIAEVKKFYIETDYENIVDNVFDILICYGGVLTTSKLKRELNDELCQLSDEFWGHIQNNNWAYLRDSDRWLFKKVCSRKVANS